MNIEKPFSLDDIVKHPREVVIMLLIGFNIYSFTTRDDCTEEVQRLNARIDTINSERVRLYEKVIFQEDVAKQQDSLLRKLTQTSVIKILSK